MKLIIKTPPCLPSPNSFPVLDRNLLDQIASINRAWTPLALQNLSDSVALFWPLGRNTRLASEVRSVHLLLACLSDCTLLFDVEHVPRMDSDTVASLPAAFEALRKGFRSLELLLLLFLLLLKPSETAGST